MQHENYHNRSTLDCHIKYQQSDEKDEVCKLVYIMIMYSNASKNIMTSGIWKKYPVLTGIFNE